MIDDPHVLGVIGLLEFTAGLYYVDDYAAQAAAGTLPAGDPIFDGQAPSGTNLPHKYVVFWLTTARGTNPRLSADMGKAAFTLSTMSVGSTVDECRRVVAKVHTRLIRQRPIVEGRTCTPILGGGAQLRPDDSINPPAWIATDVWRFSSSPSA